MAHETKTVFFDESGYTGYDLLSSEQPIFSVASSDLSDEEAKTILQHSFPRYQGAEFKFSQIWRRPSHRRRLIEFSNHLRDSFDRLFLYNCNKRFTALTKVVDTLTEPLVHDLGFDFYAGEYNRRYTNMFHFALNFFGEPELYDSVLRTYDGFSRAPNEQTLLHMQDRFRLMANSCPSELEPYLAMLEIEARLYHKHNEINNQLKSNDIQLTCVLSSVFFWRSRTKDDLEIVHDNTSNFFRQIDHWEKITSPELTPAVVTHGSGRNVEFPLRVTRTRPGDSSKSTALQLCDMVAGLSAKFLHSLGLSDDDDQFRSEVIDAGLGELMCDGIRPNTDFVEGMPKELAGPDSIDQFIAAISSSRPNG